MPPSALVVERHRASRAARANLLCSGLCWLLDRLCGRLDSSLSKLEGINDNEIECLADAWLTFVGVGVGSGFLLVSGFFVVVDVGAGFVLDLVDSGFFEVVVGVGSGFLLVVVVILLVVGGGAPDVGRLMLSVQRPPMHVMMYVWRGSRATWLFAGTCFCQKD